MGEPMCKDQWHGQKQSSSYADTVLQSCRDLNDLLSDGAQITLDGQSLDLSSVVAVAWYGTVYFQYPPAQEWHSIH